VLIQMTFPPFGRKVTVLVRGGVGVADLGCQFRGFLLAGGQELLRPVRTVVGKGSYVI